MTQGIGQSSLETFRLPDAAGTLREVIVTRCPRPTPCKPLGAGGAIFTDITRRKQTEAELRGAARSSASCSKACPGRGRHGRGVAPAGGEQGLVDLHGCTRQDLRHKSLGERRFNLRRLDGSPPFEEAPSQLAVRRQSLGDYFG